MNAPVRILLVEDSPGDARLTLEALRQGSTPSEVEVVTDGEAALAFLFRRPPHEDAARPHLVLLDLNLPKLSGHEVLAAIKEDEDLRSIPILVLSTSRDRNDIRACYRNFANAYITKPVDLDQFMEVADAIDRFWLAIAVLDGFE